MFSRLSVLLLGVVVLVALLSVLACAESQVDGVMSRGIGLMKAECPRLAIPLFRMVVNQCPNDPRAAEAAWQIGQCYLALKLTDEPMAAFKYVMKRYPDSKYASDAGVRVGYLFKRKQNRATTDADKAKYKALSDAAYKKVIDVYNADPDRCAEAELQRAVDITLEGKWDVPAVRAEVEPRLQKLMKTYPNAPRWIIARCYNTLGQMALWAKDSKSCAQIEDSVIKNFSDQKLDFGLACWVASQVYYEMGDYKTALDRAKLGARCQYGPEDGFANQNMGCSCILEVARCYSALGDLEAGRKHLQSIIAKAPDSYEATVATNWLSRWDTTSRP